MLRNLALSFALSVSGFDLAAEPKTELKALTTVADVLTFKGAAGPFKQLSTSPVMLETDEPDCPETGYCSWAEGVCACPPDYDADHWCHVSKSNCLNDCQGENWCGEDTDDSAEEPPMCPPVTGGYCSWYECACPPDYEPDSYCHLTETNCEGDCGGEWCGDDDSGESPAPTAEEVFCTSICTDDWHQLTNGIAGYACDPYFGDSNDGLTKEDCDGFGGTWTPYDCLSAHYFLEAVGAFWPEGCHYASAWASTCCTESEPCDTITCDAGTEFDKTATAGYLCYPIGSDSNFGETEENCVSLGGTWTPYSCKSAKKFMKSDDVTDWALACQMAELWAPNCCLEPLQPTVEPTPASQPTEEPTINEVCDRYYGNGGNCDWTKTYACPGSPLPGPGGYANDDGTDGFNCCCDCFSFFDDVGCGWTADWACPYMPEPGNKGYASDDGTMGYRCCCGYPSGTKATREFTAVE